jgi:hypothetical protein
MCFDSSGRGYAVGDGVFASSPAGTSWTLSPAIPEFGAQNFGFTYATAIGCSGTRTTAGGVWSSASRADPTSAWVSATIGAADDPTFVSTVRVAPTGTWLALGYWNYIGRSSDGTTFSESSSPIQIQWYNDAAFAQTGKWWVVGEMGTILNSTDDGLAFSVQSSGTQEDLYAVGFNAEGLRGVAVGAHGTAVVTGDGGATWTSEATGLDGFLGGVVWLDSTHVLIVGEKGTVLTRSF